MINAGNPSVANLQMRKYVKEHKQTSSQIFEKLNRRGRLNPVQNAMSAQLTNEQLLRFYVKETVPKLQYNNDDIQGQGGDTNSVLMSEIQRLIDVGNFNAQDAKGNMNNMQNNLIAELQTGFSSVNDSITDNLSLVKTTIDDIADNLAIYATTNDASSQNIITSLNDLNTKLEQYNTTGTTSQGALFASLTNLQTALANSNTNNAANTVAIDRLSIIMGSMGAAPGIGLPPAPVAPVLPPAPAAPVLPPAPVAPVLPPAPVAPVLPPAPVAPVLPPAPPAPAAPPAPGLPSGLIPLLPPPPSPSSNAGRLAAIAAQAAADALATGSSVMTTSTATGIQTLVAPTPNVDPLAGAKGGTDPSAATVMVAGPKVAVGVGDFPEYDEIKAKNGGKDLVMKDYRDILLKVARDLPDLFTADLEKTKTPLGKIQKVETFINSLLKPELIEYSKKILTQKMPLDQGATKLQEVSARSVLSREYGNVKIATHELQAVMRRGTPANKYQDLLNATIRQEKEIPSATRVQTQFRSHLARQEFARQKLIGVPFVAQPELYSLVRGTGPLTTSSVFTEEEMLAFFGD